MATESIWAGDLLGFEEVGNSFGNLVRSIDDSKVISIEAGYGRGKTFFRERWAKQLRADDEVVVEVDALLSDHSGDPVLTFIAALVAALPESETSSGEKLLKKSKQYGGVALRSVLRLGLRQGADEVIDMVTDEARDALGDNNAALKEAVEEFGEGLSKMAGDLIAAQVMAERVRTKEIPEQLTAIRDALTDGKPNKRIVILVDELDRCHPDYAIAFLEAMKLVFGHDGFVFCLFVNAEYLEKVATHRFGDLGQGEDYLDKFVDIRLKLPARINDLSEVFSDFIADLPEFVPLGKHSSFDLPYAQKIAKERLKINPPSMRQIKRLVAKLELIIRMNPHEAIDLPLLILMGLQSYVPVERGILCSLLPRFQLDLDYVAEMLKTDEWGNPTANAKVQRRKLFSVMPEVFDVSREACGIPATDKTNYQDWYKVGHLLAPHYIPSHQAMLDAVHRFDVKAAEET